MNPILFALCAARSQATPSPSTVSQQESQAAVRAAESAERSAQAIERIANALAPPVPAAAATPAPSKWVGSVGLGLSFLTGNAQTLTMTANIAADRKWELWKLGIRASGAYGTANPTSVGQGDVTARRAGFSMRGDPCLARW